MQCQILRRKPEVELTESALINIVTTTKDDIVDNAGREDEDDK